MANTTIITIRMVNTHTSISTTNIIIHMIDMFDTKTISITTMTIVISD